MQPFCPRHALPGALLLALTAATGATAQTYLSRAEVEDHMRESAFCYHPNDRIACAWVELYTDLNPDHLIMQSGSAVWQEPMSVMEFRLEWDDNALCIDDETQGLLAMREAAGYRFPFDLEGLDLLPEAELPAMIEELRASTPINSCFRYSNDPANPERLVQHVFYEGLLQPDTDPVVLIPRFASGVALIP